MKFSAQLKSERKRLGLTQLQAAEMLGVSQSVLEKWERVVITPKPITQEGAIARLEAADTPEVGPDVG
jgi:transcriptional regulator with XRE-family HTH domain